MNRENPPEAVVEPDLRIVDPHHHLWDYRPERTVAPQYLLEELRHDTDSGHRIDKTVFVECGHAYRTDAPHGFEEVGETDAIAAECERSSHGPGARIAGIVGSCDLRLTDRLGDILDAHEAAGRGLFRGIRHRLAFDPTGSARSSKKEPNTEGLMKSDVFRSGVAMLGERGLTFDAWIYHIQLPELIDLARAVPGTTIILDHIGAPLGVGSYAGRREEIHHWWADRIRELAACPNVVVKLGGVGMSPYGSGWAERGTVASSDEIIAEWAAPIRHIIGCFGADRCMFESNFPVDKVSFSYRTMWNAYKRLTTDLSSADRESLFAGTAERVYRV